jgi:hypothetical protein
LLEGLVLARCGFKSTVVTNIKMHKP